MNLTNEQQKAVSELREAFEEVETIAPPCNPVDRCRISIRAVIRELEQAQSSLAQREVQLKKAIEEWVGEKVLREQAQRERDEAIAEIEVQCKAKADVQVCNLQNIQAFEAMKQERDDLRAKLIASEEGKKCPKQSYSSVMELMLATGVSHEVIEKFDALRDQEIEDLQVMLHDMTEQRDKSEAAGAELRNALTVAQRGYKEGGANEDEILIDGVLSSTTCGQSFLAERERMVSLITRAIGADNYSPSDWEAWNEEAKTIVLAAVKDKP